MRKQSPLDVRWSHTDLPHMAFTLVELVFSPPAAEDSGTGSHGGSRREPRAPYRVQRADHEWVEGIREGNETLFTELVDDLGPVLYAYAYQYVRSTDIAHDVVQDVFSRLWEDRQAFQTGGTVRQYLFVATRFRALKVLRRARIEEKHHYHIVLPEGTPPIDEEIDRLDRFTAVVRAVQQLPPRQREIVQLRWIQGLPNGEVARQLGISVKGVEIQLTRALATLREHFRDY